MKIIKQNTRQECGICSLNMILDYYKYNISKEEILQKANLQNEGLSLFDIEKLGSNFNLFLETYETKWEEIFTNEQINKPFILVLKNNNYFHYVVGILKNKNTLKIYDPVGNKKTYDIKNPPLNFANIYIKVNYENWNIKKIDFNKSNFKQINWKYILCVNLIYLILLFFNLVLTMISSKITEMFPKNNIFIFLKILFIIFAFLIIQNLFNYLLAIIKNKFCKKIFLVNILEFEKIFTNKKPEFFKVIERNNFIFFYEIFKQYVLFWNEFYINVISNLIFCLVSLIIILVLNYNFMFLVLIFCVINLILNFINIIIENKNLKNQMNEKNKITKKMNNLINFFNSNYDRRILKKQINNVLYKVKELNENIYSNDLKISKFSIISNNWFQIFNLILLIFIFCFSNNFSKIIIYFSLFNIFSTNFNDLIEDLLSIKNWKIINEIINNLIKTNNFQKNSESLNIQKINFIQIDEEKFDSSFLYIKNDFCLNDFFNNNKIKLNNFNIEKYNIENLYEITCYFSFQNLIFENENFLDLNINKEIKCKFLEYFSFYNLTKTSELNYIQKIILFCFIISDKKNKLIIFQFPFEFSPETYEHQVLKEILSFICKENFVIFLNKIPIQNFTDLFVIDE